jgi:TolB-like protein/Flp pilus assembly protein TadD
MSFFSELKRRNVFRVAVAYLAAAWLLTEVAGTVFPLFGFDDGPARIVVILLAIGFPLFLIFSWVFELTPEGLKREVDASREDSITRFTGKKIDRVIVLLLAVALAYFAVDKFLLQPERERHLAEETAQAARTAAMVESYADKSIAVLPFVNRSADAEQEYFSDGISEELLNLLGRIPGLRVVSRSSSFTFKGADTPIPEIAARLNVAHVLEGSVRKDGNRVRISAQLVEARSDTQLWSRSFEAELKDIFGLQRTIAKAIGQALKFELLGLVEEGGAPPAGSGAANPAAYEAYLRGRELVRFRALEGAIEELQRSLRLDGNFAPAHAQLAIAIVLAGHDTRAAQRKAMPHLERAVALDPNLPEVYGGQALLAIMNSDHQAAAGYAGKALELNPNYNDAMNWLYIALTGLGQWRDAETMLDRMLETDPLAPGVAYNRVTLLALTGRIAEAREEADLLLVRNPRQGDTAQKVVAFTRGHIAEGLYWSLRERASNPRVWPLDLLMGFTWIGEYDEARRVDPELSAWPDMAEGRIEAAMRSLQRSLEAEPEWAYETAGVMGYVLHMDGRFEEALPYLERFYESVPRGRRIYWLFRLFPSDTQLFLQLAHAHRNAGNEEAAGPIVEFVRRDQAALHALNSELGFVFRTDALLAAYDGRQDVLIEALEQALLKGHRDPKFFDDPMFAEFRNDPRFIALQRKLDAILDEERRMALEMMCLDNPVPADWQPLPETCAGIAAD